MPDYVMRITVIACWLYQPVPVPIHLTVGFYNCIYWQIEGQADSGEALQNIQLIGCHQPAGRSCHGANNYYRVCRC